MTGLNRRPVYFLTLQPSTTPNLVVKGETRGAAGSPEVSIHWSSKLMKNVNNKLVNTKIMTPQEIQAFRAFAHTHFPPTSSQYQNSNVNYIWVKMPMVQGLSDADFLVHNGNFGTADVSKIQAAISKLDDDKVWSELGKVVAVDIFNGNNDRFDTTTGQWQNYGNIMFLASGATKVIGLDTYDPNSPTADLASGGAYPELLTLIDPVKRAAFALASVKSVGDVFRRELAGVQPGMTHLSIPVAGRPGTDLWIRVNRLPDFFMPYKQNFEDGIRLGADQLKNYLLQKHRQYSAPGRQTLMAAHRAPTRQTFMGGHRTQPQKSLPPGIIARMKYLGWLP
ncbi:MAG: hypothetical protein ACM3S5_14990 [Rhodospirillales bacterium]